MPRQRPRASGKTARPSSRAPQSQATDRSSRGPTIRNSARPQTPAGTNAGVAPPFAAALLNPTIAALADHAWRILAGVAAGAFAASAAVELTFHLSAAFAPLVFALMAIAGIAWTNRLAAWRLGQRVAPYIALFLFAAILAALTLLLKYHENLRAWLARVLLLSPALFHVVSLAPTAFATFAAFAAIQAVRSLIGVTDSPTVERQDCATTGSWRFVIGAAIGALGIFLIDHDDFAVAIIPLAGFAAAGLAAIVPAAPPPHSATVSNSLKTSWLECGFVVLSGCAVAAAPFFVDKGPLPNAQAARIAQPLLTLDPILGPTNEVNGATRIDVDSAGPLYACIRFSSHSDEKDEPLTPRIAARSIRRASSALLDGGRIVIDLPNIAVAHAAIAAFREGQFGVDRRMYYLRASLAGGRYDALIIGRDVPAFVQRTIRPNVEVHLISLHGARHLSLLMEATDAALVSPELSSWKR